MRFVIPVLAALTLALAGRAGDCPDAGARVPGARYAGRPHAMAPAAPATTAPAHPTAAQTTMMRRFQAANTTHDGHLTKQQAQAAKMTTVVRHFDAIDKDHKGYVTADDLFACVREGPACPAHPSGQAAGLATHHGRGANARRKVVTAASTVASISARSGTGGTPSDARMNRPERSSAMN